MTQPTSMSSHDADAIDLFQQAVIDGERDYEDSHGTEECDCGRSLTYRHGVGAWKCDAGHLFTSSGVRLK